MAIIAVMMSIIYIYLGLSNAKHRHKIRIDYSCDCESFCSTQDLQYMDFVGRSSEDYTYQTVDLSRLDYLKLMKP
jgi:hypothetical protein